MSKQRIRSFALAGAGLLLLAMLALGRSSEPSSTTDSNGAVAEQAEPTLQGGGAPGRGWIKRRHVDPATPGFEGVEHDGWDELSPAGRIDRVEQALVGYQERIDAAASSKQREQLQARALLLLSAARADYFADEAGRGRYLELEAALEQES